MASLQVPTASAAAQLIRKNGEVLPLKALEDFRSKIDCEIVIRGEGSEEYYRAAIDRWNKAYVTEASIIVFCESEEDIVTCLQFVQEWNLDLAVAGGRHSYAGASSATGCVVDLRKMRKVVLDKDNMTITGQGGCLARDLETPVGAEGFSVVFGAANDTGIAGITMGGGTGALTGRYGTVADNLVSAKIVLADGRVLLTSDKENSDLFWAIRGCGPNFGVVTEFTYKIHKQGLVYHGMFMFSPNKLERFLALLNPFYETVTRQNGKLLVMTAFVALPGTSGISPVALIFYDGPEEEGSEFAAPFFDLRPAMCQCSMKRYAEVTVVTPMMAGPPTHQRFACKNVQMTTPLDIEAIKGLVKDWGAFHTKYGASVAPSKLALELRSSAVTASVPVNTMAYAGRKQGCFIIAETQYDDASLDAAMRNEALTMIEKLKEGINKNAGGSEDTRLVVNANIGSGDERVQNVFGENLPRLKELKRLYDPDCIFDKWYPIRLD